MISNNDSKLSQTIQNIKGIGTQRADLFNKLNIFTVNDLISFYPRCYEDRTQIKKINELNCGDNITFEGVIASLVTRIKVNNNLSIYKVKIKDETSQIEAS